jgi:segregation and condensation protein B
MELKHVLESLLFSAHKPLTAQELRDILKAAGAEEEAREEIKALAKTKVDVIQQALDLLAHETQELNRTYRLTCVADAWQFNTKAEYGPWLRTMLGIKSRPPRLSQPALETLSIIAYRQPVTRAEILQIRGVSADGVMQTLLERDLVEAIGKAETPGRPSLYATTPQFLEYFGLRNLEELPAADELRRIPVEKPESLLTTDPGLETAPEQPLPEQIQPAPEPAVNQPAEPESAPDETPEPQPEQANNPENATSEPQEGPEKS